MQRVHLQLKLRHERARAASPAAVLSVSARERRLQLIEEKHARRSGGRAPEERGEPPLRVADARLLGERSM